MVIAERSVEEGVGIQELFIRHESNKNETVTARLVFGLFLPLPSRLLSISFIRHASGNEKAELLINQDHCTFF